MSEPTTAPETTASASIPEGSVTTGAHPQAGNAPPVPTFDMLAPMALTDLLPTNYADEAAFKKYGTFQELLEGHKNAQQFIGKDPNRLVELPLDGSDTYNDDLRGVLTRLGALEKAEDYTFTVGDDLPQDVLSDFGPDSEMGKWFQTMAHENGLLPTQAQSIYGGFVDKLAEAAKGEATDAETKRLAADNALRAALGQAYEPSKAAMNQVDNMLGGKFIEALGDAAMNPLVVAGLGKLGNLLGESHAPPDRISQAMPKTPDQLRAEAVELQSKIPALRSKGIEGVQEAQRLSERAMELYRQAGLLS